MLAALTKFYSGRAWAAGDTRQAPGLLFPNIGRYGIKSWPICLDDGFCLELYIDTWFVIGWQARGIYSLELADFLNLAAFSLTIPFFSCEILMSCAFWMPGQPPASFLGYTREMLNHWSMRAGILLETLVMSLSQHPRGAKHLVKLKQLFSNKTSGSPVPGTSSSGWCFGTWVLFSISSMGCQPSHWLSYFSRWLLHHQPVIWFIPSIIPKNPLSPLDPSGTWNLPFSQDNDPNWLSLHHFSEG